MPRWIEKVIESHAEAESPEKFFYWSALAAISATVQKRILLDRYYYKLYPNIYVFLIAKSGLRKGVPTSFGKKLAEQVPTTRIIAGRNSIQSVLKELGKAVTLESGEVLNTASAFLVSGELASFLIKDPDALTILTDLYDTHAHEPEWKNTLKVGGVDRLKEPCITLLGASNEEHFKDAVPANAIGGGFVARTAIVFAERRERINDLMEPPKIMPSAKDLGCYLQELAKVTGQFKISPEAKQLYKVWYRKLATEEHNDKTGTLERMGDQVLKVAMLLSLADEFDLVIHSRHIEESAEKCMECVAGVQQVTMGTGANASARQISLVLRELLRRQGNWMTRKMLLSKYWGEIDAIDLDRVIETLSQSGAIEVERRGKEMVYTLKKQTLEMYTEFKREVN